ncbi:unnamed protein product [Rodentolepis nana]|uniref:UPF0506 domain-containing protein n=1 Tax=Rodentolepis nana TaxID=102285 RepID=A0A0R3T7I6_RODNA|nr:unnamed protein product [Rodentolepis nana]
MFAFNVILFASLLTLANSQSTCSELGQWCDGTLFHRCCGQLQCELSSIFNGKCAECLGSGQMCSRDEQCCSKNCRWYRICD